ncbi:MAG TPA: hypothetical protein VFL91_21705 [Thermomicrobiales bacterium]|nr:hypothetical protein [Thermomicrobiales bacterium]
MLLPKIPRYTEDEVRRAQPGVLVPIRYGVAVVDGQAVQLLARTSDNPLNWDPADPIPPRSRAGVRWADPRTAYFIEFQQPFVGWLLARRPDALRSAADIRPRAGAPGGRTWLDRQPYRVLVAADDRLVGLYGTDFVLVVRGETLMAAIREAAPTHGLVAVGPPPPAAGNTPPRVG